MTRIFAVIASVALFGLAALSWWQTRAANPVPAPLAAAPAALNPEPMPDQAPAASPATREEKRFARYDKDRNGAIVLPEYLANRRKSFGRLDSNGDGVLSFEEYSVKARQKFADTDRDNSRALNRKEFATTAPVRRAKTPAPCPPSAPQAAAEGEES